MGLKLMMIDLSGTPWRWLRLTQHRDVVCLVDADDYAWACAHGWNIGWHAKTPGGAAKPPARRRVPNLGRHANLHSCGHSFSRFAVGPHEGSTRQNPSRAITNPVSAIFVVEIENLRPGTGVRKRPLGPSIPALLRRREGCDTAC
jgi:hypothetical protein